VSSFREQISLPWRLCHSTPAGPFLANPAAKKIARTICQTTSQDPSPALRHFRLLARRRERGLTSLKTINNQVRRKQIKRSKASSQDRISPRILRRCFRVYTRIRVRSLHVTLNLHLTLDRSLSHLQLNFMMGIRQNDRRSSFLTGILFDDVNSIDRVVYTDSCSRSDEP